MLEQLCGLLIIALVWIVLLRLFCKRRRPQKSQEPLNIAFVHPDLGIGGAERLIVDAAVALQQVGHDVRVYTARHEPGHCFEETKDGTLTVIVYGDFLPRRLLGRFYAACAYLRMCWVSSRIVLLSFLQYFDVIIVDQVSVCIPILRFARPCGIVFYCHFPDYLLTSKESLLKALYRSPLDFLEEQTTGAADVIFVNSKFTARIFAEAFPTLARWRIEPTVLYPPLNLKMQDQIAVEASEADSDVLKFLREDDQLLLSINRFERKKNIGLAIRAFATLPEDLKNNARLVIAGGYDKRLPENVEHAEELRLLAEELSVAERVTQMWSISAEVKAKLLQRAKCLLYTPANEHFGIVPVEAMYAQVPVLAVNSGGPCESISDEETGFLRDPKPEAWASAAAKLMRDPELQRRMGAAGRARVEARFSLATFGRVLDSTVRRLAAGLPPEKVD